LEHKTIIAPQKGITKYYPAHLIEDAGWSDGYNVQFGVGFVQKARGWTTFLPERPLCERNHLYSEGDLVIPATPNRHVYRCTVAGTSHASAEPAWPTTAGSTVTDGAVTWTEVGVNQLEGTLLHIDNYYQFNGTAYLIFITTTKIYYYNNAYATAIDITGGTLTGTTQDPVFAEIAQNVFIFTNGRDPIKYWNGTGNIADLPGLTDCEGGVTTVRAKCLIYFNQFLLLGDTTENGSHYPQRIRWSKLGDIYTWKNDVNGLGQAGYADLTDGVDWVQTMRPFGNYLVVYKERSIQVLSYIGGDLIWDKRPAIIGTGLLAPKALCDLGDEQLFIGPDNVYSFDLIEPKIAGDDVAKEFFRILDPVAAGYTTGSFFIEEMPEVWFYFTSIDSPDGFPDKAMVYNSDTKAWSWRDAPMVAYGYYKQDVSLTIDMLENSIDSWNDEIDSSINMENAPLNICGDKDGNLFVLGGNAFNGSAIESWLTTKLFDFDAPGSVKRLLRLQLMISREGPYNLPVYVGTADNVDEPVKWQGPYYMNLDKTYPPWIDMDLSARYFCLKFGTVGADEPYKITGYILYYQLRGAI
jgi:hypothetical protein